MEHGTSRQPRLGGGVLLEKSRWGKREFFFFLRSPPVLTFPKLLFLPYTFLFSLSVVSANTGPLMA
jgi:hypothetical protein